MGRTKGHVAILLSCVIFSTNIIVTSDLTANWMTPMGYTMTRMLYGAIALWIISLFLPKEKVGRQDLLILAVGGLLGFIVSQLAFATSVRYTSPVNFSLIMAMVPIMVLVLSAIFLREGITLPKVGGIALSILGAALIILQRGGSEIQGSNNMLGILMAALSMSSYGAYLVITRHVTQKYASITILKWTFLFSAIMLLPFAFTELFNQRIFTSEVTTGAILRLSFVLIFDATIVFFLLLAALHSLKATTVSTYLNLLPVFTAAIAITIGQEVLTLYKVAATVLVVGGVCLVTRSNSGADEATTPRGAEYAIDNTPGQEIGNEGHG